MLWVSGFLYNNGGQPTFRTLSVVADGMLHHSPTRDWPGTVQETCTASVLMQCTAWRVMLVLAGAM